MSDFDFLVRMRLQTIDYNHNGKIDGAQEVNKAKEIGVNAKDGDKIEEIIQDSAKINIQELLKQIDQTQTVDKKEDPLKRRKYSAIG